MKEIIVTENAPGAIGPYSQGVSFQNLVFTSGQIAFNPKTMKLIEGGIEEQARQTLQNLQAVLEAGGAGMNSVLKVTCFIANMDHFAAFNSVYETFFADSKPARSCVEVARLPKDALIEVEAIAVKIK